MSSMEEMPYTIHVEGNIGAGKSTFLKYFRQFENVDVLAEPVELYQNLNGTNVLDLVYKEPKKWTFPFQTYVHLIMLPYHLKPTERKVKIMERSLFSAQHILVEIARQNKQIEKAEHDILQKWNDFTTENFAVKPNLIVYLRAEPHQVCNRIKKRGRCEESNIDFEYINQIHDLHDKWLLGKECHNVSVLVLNANLSAREVQQEFEESEYALRIGLPKIK